MPLISSLRQRLKLKKKLNSCQEMRKNQKPACFYLQTGFYFLNAWIDENEKYGDYDHD